MTEHDASDPPDGSDLLARISREMVRAQKKYFGRGPTSAKSYMIDDFLLVIMRGSRTVAEQTMLDFGQADLVRNFRQQFENEMTGRLTGMIEDVTGRNVLGYQSQVLFEPEVVLEIFFFEDRVDEGEVAESIGEAPSGSEDDAVSRPSQADRRPPDAGT